MWMLHDHEKWLEIALPFRSQTDTSDYVYSKNLIKFFELENFCVFTSELEMIEIKIEEAIELDIHEVTNHGRFHIMFKF